MDLTQFAATPDDFASLHEVRVKTEKSKKSRRKTRTSLDLPDKGDRFIRGPIPMDWLRAASRCGYRAEAVAVLLWYAAAWQKSNPAKLTPAVLSELHVHPRTARRVLVKFRDAGLVDVEFHRGRSPLVTIRPVQTGADLRPTASAVLPSRG